MATPTDAARVAERVRALYPAAVAVHLGGDPDRAPHGVWYFKFDRVPGEAVLESPTGTFPFTVRADSDAPNDAAEVLNLADAVTVIGKYLDDLLARAPAVVAPPAVSARPAPPAPGPRRHAPDV